jgi:elongation factor 2
MSRYRKRLDEIMVLMPNKNLIRNVGIVAHIDHGKTTLSDSLLSASGYLSDELAGTVRALDYLDEEQKRGITIKTANVSLLYNQNNKSFLINLIDTPGHVDFTGSVTRALRIIDGVVVVVDAVEEIMVQTETVTRQALSESIKPILFINKVDRLITELRLTEKEIQNKFQKIILEFNNLIENYAVDKISKKWNVNPKDNSVSFGSAIDRWGFNHEIFSKKNLKFDYILKKYSEGQKETLKEILPVHEPIYQAIINNLPNPIEAQKYRAEKIWIGDIESEAGKNISDCDSLGPLILFISKIDYDPKTKFLATARIFSGTISRGQNVVLLSDYSTQNVNQIFLLMGSSREPLESASSGNIIALGGLKNIRAGETIVSSGFENKMLPFEQIKYFSEPVITVSLEPTKLTQLPEIIENLETFIIQDPNLKILINSETGEYLLSGIGELHLEITLKKLKEIGLEVIPSEPMVVYREGIKNYSQDVISTNLTVKKINISIEPLTKEVIEFLNLNKINGSKSDKLINQFKRKFIHNQKIQKTLEILPNENIIVKEFEHELPDRLKENLVQILENKLKSGLLCEEPVQGIMISLKEINIDDKNLNLAELTSKINDLFNSVYIKANPTLLEPIFKIQINLPNELVGKATNIIRQRKGDITNINEIKGNAIITGFIPVRESFGLSKELRSKTSGRAFWQTQFHDWQPIAEKEQKQVVNEIRKRKGL